MGCACSDRIASARCAAYRPQREPIARARAVRGVAFVSQSVTVSPPASTGARNRDIGFSHFVSLGENADSAPAMSSTTWAMTR